MLCLAGPALARAEAALELSPVHAGQVRVDGQLGEWRGARFAQLGDGDADGSLEYALAFEDGAEPALYIGARVLDDDFVRSGRPGRGEDALVVTLSMPRASGRFVETQVWLFAGVVGRSPASAALATGGGAPRNDARVKVVEGPLRDGDAKGYVLEARIPLAVIERGRELHVGRGAIALHDVDRDRKRPRRVASSSGRLPPLGVGANAALYSFLRQKSLSPRSLRHDLIGDVFGDRRLERVVLAETFAVVVGPDIDGGNGFHYVDLPVTRATAIRRASLRDLTADGKRELMVVLRQDNDRGSRDLLQVLDLSLQRATTRLSVELRKQTAQGEVAAELRVAQAKAGRPPALVVSAGEARGLTADNYREQPARDAEPILLPFGKVKSRTYRWDGSRFKLEKAVDNDAYVEPGAASARSAAPAPGPAKTATHDKPPGVDALIAAFRSARGIDPQARPRFVRHVNLAEDRRVESLMLFGKHLLVLGKGFRGGSGFFYFELPVAAAADIQRLFTGDVTGDGRREIFVRFRQVLGGPDGEPVQREILLGYTFAGESLQPVVAVEVRRAQGGRSVGNVVKLVPDQRHWTLVIAPGRARGWGAGNYPFVTESIDGYERLLLPWRDRTKRYRF